MKFFHWQGCESLSLVHDNDESFVEIADEIAMNRGEIIDLCVYDSLLTIMFGSVKFVWNNLKWCMKILGWEGWGSWEKIGYLEKIAVTIITLVKIFENKYIVKSILPMPLLIA